GTWQFLSVAALRECEKPIVVQDDLESVFHVLLYMAIRFLPHNCPKELVGKLLFEFFDDATETPRGYGCGPKKAETMKTGVIDFELDGKVVNLKFTWPRDQNIVHPINDVLATLLGWLQAYYATLRPQEPDHRAGPGGDAHGPKKQTFLEKLRIAGMSKNTPPPPPPPPINSARLEDANKLASHDAIIELFNAYLDVTQYKWPTEDKTEDKRPKKGYKPGQDVERLPTNYMTGSSKDLKHTLEGGPDLGPPSDPKKAKLELPERPNPSDAEPL
ncbi:hypothetical protein C8Q77DRAFT_332771, partial [Trametes polyzona]